MSTYQGEYLVASRFFVFISTVVFSLLFFAASTQAASLWATPTPANPSVTDSQPLELGTKFFADRPGYITGVRFYKASGDIGTHIGNLWTIGGTRLASVTFKGETASGWQQMNFPIAIPITASTTYVVSYFSPQSYFATTDSYFTGPYDNSPLHAPSSSGSGGNSVYSYGATSVFPTSSYIARNYWIDAIFTEHATTAPPVINSFTASPSSIFVGQSSTLSWSTLDASTLTINQGIGTVTGSSVTVSPTITTTYTLTAANSAGTTTANVTVAASVKPPPAPNPILVITSTANKFSNYLGEILSAEGYNEYTLADISDVNASVLSNFDTVVLGDMSLNSSQITMFTNWVNAGGNLIAMSPDPQLASLLGITSAGATLSDAYVGIDTSQAPGAGIVSQTIQYHSSADRYTLNGARAVATLYSNATTPTTNPAVTIRSVGAGQAAAFTFDLARSIVYTRQGNPAWVGQERDDPVQNIVKVLDMMYPDYLDLNKVSIPQADEMQRLFANLILTMQQNSNKKPLPHFWYMPHMLKAVVLAAEDDHDAGGVADIFNQMLAASPAGCSVADWTCYRGTAWAYRQSMDPYSPFLRSTGV
jgi:hypothetical protein